MKHPLPRCLCLLAAVLLLGAAGALAQSDQAPATRPTPVSAERLPQLSDRLADLRIRDGQVIVSAPDGGEQALSADAFIQSLEERQHEKRSRHWLLQLVDVTSPLGLIWVAVGFLGQLIFMGRMIVQWLASERRKQSVVPTLFWWMSLVGGSMVLAYFIWRKDPVGIFGQAMGWTIYARNLWLIYFPATPHTVDTPVVVPIADADQGTSGPASSANRNQAPVVRS